MTEYVSTRMQEGRIRKKLFFLENELEVFLSVHCEIQHIVIHAEAVEYYNFNLQEQNEPLIIQFISIGNKQLLCGKTILILFQNFTFQSSSLVFQKHLYPLLYTLEKYKVLHYYLSFHR